MDNVQASVVGASVVSFLPGVSAQQRESVQLATLFAQRAALSAYKDGQVEDWYSYYKNQLKYFGWDATPADATYRPDPSRQRVVEQALEKISQVAGRPYAEASRRSIDALEKDGNALSLFESRSRNLDYAYFQLIPCSQALQVLSTWCCTMKRSISRSRAAVFCFSRTRLFHPRGRNWCASIRAGSSTHTETGSW
ncbi:hypothetical protein G3O07_08945 [Pseudomonas laurentiana]|uniref:Uncharacterized protein n=1 Tax=Pseudomonas laurentiana TaxID=2364649 RepID=A0A6I5RNW7_9PSED|nr:hypothetical protein [Pseudomonas laurentiana]